MAWVETMLGTGPAMAQEDDRGTEVMSWLAGGTVLVALVLFALAQSLRLPAHFGVEDWLGWKNPATLARTLDAWRLVHGHERIPAATAYLLIDTALFMPLYGLALLWATRQLRQTLKGGGFAGFIDILYALAVPALLVLWGLDLIENLGGFTRLGVSIGWGLAALAAALTAFWLMRRWARDPQTGSGLVAIAWLTVVLLLAGFASYHIDAGQPATPRPFGGWAHEGKRWATLAALAPLAGLWLAWWFGLDLDPRAADRPGEIRSACRQVAMGVIGRSRYVLALLGLFAAFTLMLDQCRDVLLALATAEFSWWWLFIMAVGAMALGMLSHACWRWARLIGRIKRSGYDVSGLDGVAAWAGEWARTWARLLMLLPLLLTLTLIANVAGDAVIAAKDHEPPGGLLWTQAKLALFALLIVAFALWLLHQKRKKALKRPQDYYNSVEDVRILLHDPDCPPTALRRAAQAPAETTPPPEAPAPASIARLRHPVRLLGEVVDVLAAPVRQPLFALAMLGVVRACMLLDPDMTAAAPPALAVLALSIVWWLGPLGLIAMSEQRAVFPWGLLLLLVAGLVGFWSDNHTLPALVIDDLAAVQPTLQALARVALAGFTLLAVLGGLAWLILALRSRDLLRLLRRRVDPERRHRVADYWRTGLCLGCLVLLCAGLIGLDRWAASAMPQPAATAAEGEAALAAPGADPVLLVASEGGGVRAAYWTAMVLAEVARTNPGWDGRIAAMSGVSGGSMGIAVWRACARDPSHALDSQGRRPGLEDCIRKGFRDLDPLSPLLAGLMFEDVWMRLLPTDTLCHPDSGCGMRSRAMAFEREWMRAFQGLAQPLGMRRPGEPDLLFNSTVVESGNRGVLSTHRFDGSGLPGAEDLLASGRIPRSPALVTAAHTSARFPGTNPLASLPHQASGPAAAHLVDGGYHDNSGTASVANVLALLRATGPERRVQLVLIRNGQVPTRCLPQAIEENGDEPPETCFDHNNSDDRELLPPRDAQRLKLYADLFGPAVTVLNNLGTGAHGREPVAALAALAASAPLQGGMGCGPASAVCLLDQMEDASLVPLGWSLSEAARTAMDTRARDRAEQVRCRLAGGCPGQP
ncbi:hypothetical protein LXT12_01870 [Pelomonas sp. P7]|uniref:Patatin-like phospholipase n=1 Tax=Pelomonas caseinilytica TaxID=2906763 RepID=A0ABS8XAM6_9BURK|nr:hypothetical protein [Pelomonas sp. P7]MCE4536007.1 hypothetical protein [Pelomonas sp. P7]